MSLKVLLNFKLNWVLLCASFWLFALPIQAKYVVAVVGKTKNDSFYQQAFKGCEQFAKQHLDFECIYDGPKDFQDIRTQVLVITDLVRRNNISGLLIATTDSNYLVERALKQLKDNNIPVITFDSDLLEEDQQYRLAYVGTNNFDYGVALGNELKKFTNKENNQVCIQSGHSTTPNLNKRIEGVRYALSGQKDKRLSGENGWSEFDRCPLYSLGKREVSLGQLDKLLNLENPPLFLAVAGFAQFNPNYANVIAKHKQRIANQEVVIVSADTEQMQLAVLQQGLSSANIGQNPFEMGRLSAELMYQYLTKGERPAKSHYYLDFHYCQQSNAGTCTVNH